MYNFEYFWLYDIEKNTDIYIKASPFGRFFEIPGRLISYSQTFTQDICLFLYITSYFFNATIMKLSLSFILYGPLQADIFQIQMGPTSYSQTLSQTISFNFMHDFTYFLVKLYWKWRKITFTVAPSDEIFQNWWLTPTCHSQKYTHKVRLSMHIFVHFCWYISNKRTYGNTHTLTDIHFIKTWFLGFLSSQIG